MEEKKDITLTCEDCGTEFLFTVGEQEFYEEKQLPNKPKRCKECRAKRKANARGPRPQKEEEN